MRIVARVLCLALLMLAIPSASFAGIFLSVSFGPPALPVYVQPVCPAPGYIWTPGYWAYGPAGYFWVPGTWVVAPTPGLLWTPGYWGWSGGAFVWNAGYWGPHIGFYGGINYGFGYGGAGYEGGYWQGGQFMYNRSVTNVSNTTVTNVYNKTVINNTTVNNVSYNGGTGGVTTQPTAEEKVAASETHTQPTAEQVQHVTSASNNHALLASVNHGAPAVAATAKPGDFAHPVAAKSAGGEYHAPPPNAHAENQVEPGKVPPRTTNTVASNAAKPANNVPKPANTPRPANNVRSDNMMHANPVNTPRPANQPAHENMARPVNTPHPVSQPQHQNAQPHPQPPAHQAPPKPEKPEKPQH